MGGTASKITSLTIVYATQAQRPAVWLRLDKQP